MMPFKDMMIAKTGSAALVKNPIDYTPYLKDYPTDFVNPDNSTYKVGRKEFVENVAPANNIGENEHYFEIGEPEIYRNYLDGKRKKAEMGDEDAKKIVEESKNKYKAPYISTTWTNLEYGIPNAVFEQYLKRPDIQEMLRSPKTRPDEIVKKIHELINQNDKKHVDRVTNHKKKKKKTTTDEKTTPKKASASMSFRDMMSSREAQKEYGAPSSFCKNGNLLVRGEDGSFHKSSFEKGKQTRLNRRYLGERNGREPYPYPGYTSLDWNPEPDPMVIDDDILKQAITGYLSDPDIRRALTDMVDAAKKKKMTITTTDLESDAPNMEGYVSEETINPLAEAREELANVGIDDDDKFKMQIARNNLTERGFNSSEAENMTGRAMNDKRDLTHTHHDERKPDMMDGRFLAGYGPNTKSPKPTKPFAEEHPELVSS